MAVAGSVHVLVCVVAVPRRYRRRLTTISIVDRSSGTPQRIEARANNVKVIAVCSDDGGLWFLVVVVVSAPFRWVASFPLSRPTVLKGQKGRPQSGHGYRLEDPHQIRWDR